MNVKINQRRPTRKGDIMTTPNGIALCTGDHGQGLSFRWIDRAEALLYEAAQAGMAREFPQNVCI
jgi:hypothetical protein